MSSATEIGTETLIVTPLALEKVREIQAERDLGNYLLRVFVAGAGCSGIQYGMAFEERAQDDDTVVEFDGLSLCIDSGSLPYVLGASIDYVEGPMGAGFRVENPNVAPSHACGCGSGCSC